MNNDFSKFDIKKILPSVNNMKELYAIINGELILEKEASLGINDLSIVRGYGIFDYFKTLNHRVLFLDDNIDRFYMSARLMDLPVTYSKEQLKALIHKIIDCNRIANSGIKVLLTGGYSPDGYSITTPNLIITQHEYNRNTEQEHKGLKLLLHQFHRPFSSAKTIDYVMGIQALKLAHQQGADDVLYVEHGLISECPRANFFLITPNNTLLTTGEDVLAGITRKHIIEMVRDQFAVEIRPVTLQDVLEAKEAFICSTTKNITPITAILNYKEYGSEVGPVTRKLQILFDNYIANI